MKNHLLKGLSIGLVLFLTVEIIVPTINLTETTISLSSLVRGIFVWTTGGLVYGVLDYIFRKRPVEKQ